jgi:AraC family transcriptional regulator, regulatory protein of adaptative response / methylated-DNA-[protein]-cysteine methyltransferase
MELSEDIMYQASVDRDASFEGMFYVAVKTTRIFCRPTCRARKPKRENVEFLKTIHEAQNKGYRACKVCRPLELLNATPPLIHDLLEELNANPDLKLKDEDLRKRGIAPHALRRWFLKHHGLTFQAFQRKRLLNQAFKTIQNGTAVSDAAWGTGYESLSGFSDSFKSTFGVSPSNSKGKTILDLKRFETFLGVMWAVASPKGICLLSFAEQYELETQLSNLAAAHDAKLLHGENPHFDQLIEQVNAYLAGKNREIKVALDFHYQALEHYLHVATMLIPYGHSIDWSDFCSKIPIQSKPEQLQELLSNNRFGLLMPIHRIRNWDDGLEEMLKRRNHFLRELEQKHAT